MRLQTISVVLTAAGLALASAPAALATSHANSGGAAFAPAALSSPAAALPPAVSVPAAPAAPPPSPGPGPVPPGSVTVHTGGQANGVTLPAAAPVIIPGALAKILPNGFAAAPADAPPAVQQAIFAANQIVGRPYVYGGGHQSFTSAGYDCSGTVSFALHGASLLTTPMDSSEFMHWGVRGVGQWITVFSNPGHVYMNIAGIRLDTSAAGDPSRLAGPRWRPLLRSSAHFRIRSLPGL